MNRIKAMLMTGSVVPMVRQKDLSRMQVPLLTSPEGTAARLQFVNGAPSVILRTQEESAIAVAVKTVEDIKNILDTYRATFDDPNYTTMLLELS